jgi:adenine deaminase
MTQFARLVVPMGTAGIAIDFSEAGRFKGVEAMRVFLDEMNQTPLKPFFSPFFRLLLEVGGYPPVTLEEFKEVLSWPECVELREWHVAAERHPSADVRELGRIAREKGILLSGHLRNLAGKPLNASVAAGVGSDHESKTLQEALDRMRLGVAVQMRFGSVHLDEMQVMLEAVTRERLDPRLLMFSTDEMDIDDVVKIGFLDTRVRIAIEQGVSPIDAIRMGSLNPASYLGKSHEIGSLTPGRIAFINLVDDLRAFNITNVIYGEEIVAENGKYIGQLEKFEFPESFYQTIQLESDLIADDFRIPVEGNKETVKVRAMGWVVGTKPTSEKILEMPVDNGDVHPSVEMDVAKLAVVERQYHTGKMGKGLCQGFGLKRGAVGLSYHVNACNMGIVGMNESDMAIVGNRIAELGGGIVAVADGEILAEIPMPITGLVTDEPAEAVAADMAEMKRTLKEELGLWQDEIGMYLMLAVLFIPGNLPLIRINLDGLCRNEIVDGKLTIKPLPNIVEDDE